VGAAGVGLTLFSGVSLDDEPGWTSLILISHLGEFVDSLNIRSLTNLLRRFT